MEYKSLNKTEVSFSTATDSHGWLQFKGTDVCMDIHCKKCGCRSHIDGDFVYFIRCPKCNTVYELNGHIELIERDEKEIKSNISEPDIA